MQQMCCNIYNNANSTYLAFTLDCREASTIAYLRETATGPVQNALCDSVVKFN